MGTRPGMTTEEKQQAALLAAQGMTNHAIGKAIGRDEKTVKKELLKPETALQVMDAQEHLAGLFEQRAVQYMESITTEDILKMDAYKRTLSAGIAIDKARLIKGQSNVNMAVVIASACRASMEYEE